MRSLIALAVVSLSLSMSTPVLSDDVAASASVASPVVATGAMAAAQAAGIQRAHARASMDSPTADCCFDAVILDREIPPAATDRGPSCCWDVPSWD